MSAIVEACQGRSNSIAEPPHYSNYNNNRVALEDTDWFNHSPTSAPTSGPLTAPVRTERDGTEYEHEELPPAYEATDLPEYFVEDPSAPPIHRYHLRQISRNIQTLAPSAPHKTDLYQLSTRTGPRLFSKKADITLSRATISSDLVASQGNSPSENRNFEQEGPVQIVKVNFDDSGKLPWMPRANITKLIPGNRTYTIPMEARNFRDWKLRFLSSTGNEDEASSVGFFWHLTERPLALELFDLSRHYAIAKFVHSRLGTRATNGEEIGQLLIYKLYELPHGPDIDLVIGSLALVMAHFRRMGRHHYGTKTMPEAFGDTSASTDVTQAGYGSRSYSAF